MSGRIYLVGEGDNLVSLEEKTYAAEAVLQKLLADHPDLLAGEQVSPSAPRRWLLISRCGTGTSDNSRLDESIVSAGASVTAVAPYMDL